jgi:transposase
MGWSGRAPALSAIEAGKGAKDKEHTMSRTLNSSIAVAGIDIGKNTFLVVGLDERGAIAFVRSGRVVRSKRVLPTCPLLDWHGGLHRRTSSQSQAQDTRSQCPADAGEVRPYSKGQKNDFRDAEAIAEAVQRPTMKFVATKTADQLDLQALHRVNGWSASAPVSSIRSVPSC